MQSNLLILAALALTAFSAKAQTTIYEHDRNGYPEFERTTYPDGSTKTTHYDFDRNGNLDSVRRTSTEPIPTPTPWPVFSAASNSSHVARSIAPVATPVTPAVVTQAPVTVVQGTMTPEEIQRLVNGK
jgi:hypothetical protein